MSQFTLRHISRIEARPGLGRLQFARLLGAQLNKIQRPMRSREMRALQGTLPLMDGNPLRNWNVSRDLHRVIGSEWPKPVMHSALVM